MLIIELFLVLLVAHRGLELHLTAHFLFRVMCQLLITTAVAEIATLFLAHAQLPHCDMLYAIQCFIASYVPRQLHGVPSPRYYGDVYSKARDWLARVEQHIKTDKEREAFELACEVVDAGAANTIDMIALLACKSPAELQKHMHKWYPDVEKDASDRIIGGGMAMRNGVAASGRCVAVSCTHFCRECRAVSPHLTSSLFFSSPLACRHRARSICHQAPPCDLASIWRLAKQPLDAILNSTDSVRGNFDGDPDDHFVNFVKQHNALSIDEFTQRMVDEFGILQRSVFFCQVFFKNNLFTLTREIQARGIVYIWLADSAFFPL